MRKSFLKITVATVIMASFASCEKESTESTDRPEEINNFSSKEIQLSQEQIEALNLLRIGTGDSSATEIEFESNGEIQKRIVVDDALISYSKLNNTIEKIKNATSEDGASPRLDVFKSRVNVPNRGKRKIVVLIDDFANKGTPKEVNAAIIAVQRYEALKLAKLSFEYVLVSNLASGAVTLDAAPDISILFLPDNFIPNGFFGFADFPENGNAGRNITMAKGRLNVGTQQQISIVLQHEIGHTLGFVHSDHLTRRSCGGELESDNLDATALEQVPGTGPTGDNGNSIMTACGSFNRPNFTSSDIRDFRNVYNGNF